MERTFTKAEILRLLLCPGRLTINHLPSAKPNSFLWVCFDDYARRVEIAVIIEDEMIQATAISAFRKV